MNCPACKTNALQMHDLEPELPSLQCTACGGQWIQSFRYWRWRSLQPTDLPEIPHAPDDLPAVMEAHQANVCPECGHILVPYRVGHGVAFSLDHCGHCGGMWFEKNEWEVLRSRNLHDDVHKVFNQVWQSDVSREERRATREARLTTLLGDQDLSEIRRVKAWLDGHPRRSEIYALLLERREG
jgi:Zn-finger nucleic acid-binding protein